MYKGIEISRDRNEGLFIGPGDFGVMPCGGAETGRRGRRGQNTVLKHAMSSDAKLFTANRLIQSPSSRGGDADFFRSLYPKLPHLSPDEVSRAFDIFDTTGMSAQQLAHPPSMKNIEFNCLYFLLGGQCRAMINATLSESGRGAVFNVWSDAEDIDLVTTHQRVMAILFHITGEAAKNDVSAGGDVGLAANAIARIREVPRRSAQKGLPDTLQVLGDEDLQVGRLIKEYVGRLRGARR